MLQTAGDSPVCGLSGQCPTGQLCKGHCVSIKAAADAAAPGIYCARAQSGGIARLDDSRRLTVGLQLQQPRVADAAGGRISSRSD